MAKELMKKINTERLILRKFKLEDAEEMFRNWATDSKTTLYLTWDPHNSVEETKGLIKIWIESYKDGGLNWIVEEKSSKEVIGNIAVMDYEEETKTCELGYCYGSKFWGKGYASEALESVIKFLFEELNIQNITAFHIGENTASGRVMEKVGMTKYKVIPNSKFNKNIQFLDTEVRYKITKEDYEKRIH